MKKSNPELISEIEQRFDVVVFDTETRKIVGIAGENLSYDSGTVNAVERLETVLMIIDRADSGSRRYAVITEAGKHIVGDELI